MTETPRPDGPRDCRGCGARFPRTPWALDRDLRASPECWRAYGEIAMFAADRLPVTAAVVQLAADAYAAQHAGPPTPPGETAAALVGLYLSLDRGLAGDDVLAARARVLAAPFAGLFAGPVLEPPAGAGGVPTVADVHAAGVAAASASGHVHAVRTWAEAVWRQWAPRHADVAALAGE